MVRGLIVAAAILVPRLFAQQSQSRRPSGGRRSFGGGAAYANRRP